MAREMGWTQRAALTALADAGGAMWLDELGEALGLTPRRTRALMGTLEARGEVAARVVGRDRIGVGEFGPREWARWDHPTRSIGMPRRMTRVWLGPNPYRTVSPGGNRAVRM